MAGDAAVRHRVDADDDPRRPRRLRLHREPVHPSELAPRGGGAGETRHREHVEGQMGERNPRVQLVLAVGAVFAVIVAAQAIAGGISFRAEN